MSVGSAGAWCRFLRRARATFERFDQNIRVRYPYLAVVRPLPIFVYIVSSWGLCAALARLLRGTVHQPLDPAPFTVAWLALSSVVATLWTYSQWRARTDLPRSVAFPRIWSFAPTLIIISLLLSPSLIWEWLAHSSIRQLLTSQDCEILFGSVTNFDRWPSQTGASTAVKIKFEWIQQFAPAGISATTALVPEKPKRISLGGWGRKPHSERDMWLEDKDYRFCHILFTEEQPLLRDRLTRLLPPDVPVQYQEACSENLYGETLNPSGLLLTDDRRLRLNYSPAWVGDVPTPVEFMK